MKKLMSMLLALLILTAGLALAEGWQPVEQTWTEKVTYWGEGVFIVDFMRDVPWRTEYTMEARDDFGNSFTLAALGGDASEAVVQIGGDVQEDRLYTITLYSRENVIYAIGQSTKGFTYANYCEYCLEFGHDEQVCAERIAAGVYEVDRCDLCGELGHGDDSCPTRKSGAYCDECGQYGHDDDACPYYDGDDPYDRCDRCGQLGHDEDRCTGIVQSTPSPTPMPAAVSDTQRVSATPTPMPLKNEYCDECGTWGHDDDECPYEWCERCGERGHDDDRCPTRTCKRCGQTGHSKDDCPNERCDECGQYGHDDDDCPNERCDECGQYGHDDDNCPYDRDDD